MKIIPLKPELELIFWQHVTQDIPHFYFFAFDWKYNRDETKILLALEGNRIDGMMVVYRQSIVQLRGSSKAARVLLERLDLEKVELQALEQHKQYVLEKYKPTLSHQLVLMTLRKGEEKLQVKYPSVKLNRSNAEQIATIMKHADPEYWGDVTGRQIVESMNRSASWFGIETEEELVSVGSTRLTEWAGLVGVVATHEGHRNKGYATSVVSKLVEQILEKQSLAMIYVQSDNSPAVRAYTKVGFKPYRTYFFMRGEKH